MAGKRNTSTKSITLFCFFHLIGLIICEFVVFFTVDFTHWNRTSMSTGIACLTSSYISNNWNIAWSIGSTQPTLGNQQVNYIDQECSNKKEEKENSLWDEQSHKRCQGKRIPDRSSKAVGNEKATHSFVGYGRQNVWARPQSCMKQCEVLFHQEILMKRFGIT